MDKLLRSLKSPFANRCVGNRDGRPVERFVNLHELAAATLASLLLLRSFDAP